MFQIEHLDLPRHELVNVANAMLVGDMNLIKGIRRICKLRFSVRDPENEVFLAIRGIESETDTYPVGRVRLNYTLEYLRRIDVEMQGYLEQAKGDIFQACQAIVQTFSY
ncbi:MAG: hypothetical protein GZ090_07485 [Oxalobacteraceae bacterium]|nr:hypothetical protein [Oxalobacteraceae bacterium]